MKSTKKKTKLTEYKTLEEIKADFLEQSHLEGLELSQSDVMEQSSIWICQTAI